jgi:hypothetical protein
MHTRKEVREAFRQYRRRLGLPLAYPTDAIRVGDLCYFDRDGRAISLGNVFDGTGEEGRVSRIVEQDIDPIVSNGMGCRTLSEAELSEYPIIAPLSSPCLRDKINLFLGMNLMIIAFKRDIYYPAIN